MEAWVKPAATLPHTVGWILYNGDVNNGYGFLQYGDHFTCQWHGGFVEEFGWAAAIPGQWVHLAIVVQNVKATFYVNGVASGNTVRPASAVPAAGQLSIGKGYHYDFRSSGAIDEVRLATFMPGQFDPTSLLIKSIPPEVSAPTANSIAATSAVLGGSVTSRNGNPVTERGVVFSKTLENGDPQVGGTGVSKQVAPGDYGVFTVGVAALSPVTQVFLPALCHQHGGDDLRPGGQLHDLSRSIHPAGLVSLRRGGSGSRGGRQFRGDAG